MLLDGLQKVDFSTPDTLLIVDDDGINREILRAIFEPFYPIR